MGLFQFPFKQNNTSPSSPAPTPAPAQTQPERKVTVQSEPARPQPQSQQAPAKPEPPKGPEMWRILLTMSTPDKAKHDKFFTELIRKCIYDWHHIAGRVGMHTDNKKVRIELKGMHEDVEKLLAWCKLDHYGVHAILVEKYVISSMPYAGLFQRKTGSWS